MFEWLEGTTVALWVGESLWGYPFLLGLHVVGLAIVVGIFVVRDLRLLGLFTGIDPASLAALQKLCWSGFVINAVSGAFLFSSQATTFVESVPFLLKIAMIFLAVGCAATIQYRLRGDVSEWSNDGAVTGSIRIVAVLSILLWTGAIVSGRLIAYV